MTLPPVASPRLAKRLALYAHFMGARAAEGNLPRDPISKSKKTRH